MASIFHCARHLLERMIDWLETRGHDMRFVLLFILAYSFLLRSAM